MKPKIKIEKVSYNNSEDVRIMKACLESWFQNPKDLNLTSPNMRYPFNFKQWLAVSYNNKNTVTFVLKKDDWIIGHMSLQIQQEKEFVHLFHVFIDRDNRGKGYAKHLLEKAINYAHDAGYKAMTLYVKPTNVVAINLYRSYGFTETGEIAQSGSPKFRLQLN